MSACRNALPLIACVLLLAACSEQAPPQEAPGDAPRDAPPSVTDLRGGRAQGVTVSEAPPEEGGASGTATGARELEWDALIPDDFQPDKLLSEYPIDDLSDDDPRAAELMAKLQELWDKAPVRQDLDGAEVRLPGFVVPVEADERETTGFLLVPYYGACVHVPPPPANQTVYVVTEAGKGTRPELFDVIWVTGTMSVRRIENDVAEAGYTLYASRIEPYE
jgi:hypothetical protein